MIRITRVNFEPHEDILKEMHTVCFGYGPEDWLISGQWWIAYDKKRPVAFCALTSFRKYKDRGYLARAGVLSDWRGQGLQKRMIVTREKEARKRGYKWLYSDTTDSVVSSNNLIASGYRMYKPRDPYSYANSIYFRKRIV